MRRIAFLKNCAIAFFCVFLSASAAWGRGPAAAPAPQAASQITYMFCLSHGGDNAYFSDIFVFDPSTDADAIAWKAAIERDQRNGGHANPGPAPWVAEFDKLIAQKSPRNSGGACNAYSNLADAQRRLAEVIDYEKRYQSKVVQTGWKYSHAVSPAPSSAPAAPAAPIAAAPVAPAQPTTPPRASSIPRAAAPPAKSALVPAPAASQTPFTVCWGETFGKNPSAYFSDPFAAPVKDTPAWYKSFREALNSKYGRASAGPLHCNTLKSQADAQVYLQTTEDKLRAHHQVIQTGWKYQ